MRISIEEKQTLVARYWAGESVADICADSSVPRSTFYTWIKPYTVTVTDSGYTVSQQAFIKMKQKLQKLEQMIEILCSAMSCRALRRAARASASTGLSASARSFLIFSL